MARFRGHPVEAIVPVAHGAAIAGIRNGELAFASPDYEWPIPDVCLSEYRAQRDAFAVTGSPALPAGLNLGSQLHYLEWLDRARFEQSTLMPYAQYWAWLLSGVAVSEVTSLGCHSDIWAPEAGDFSPMACRRGWAGQFAPLVSANAVLGTLRPALAAQTGLSPNVRIHAGIHDSNAALIAARGFREFSGQEATILSTGTWFIALRSPREPVDIAALPETRDCLVNVDAYGQPVPSARVMGGREIELLGARIDRPGTAGLSDVLAAKSMALPSQVPGCGPFPNREPRLVDWPSDPEEQAAAVALYAALMADTVLDLIGSVERLLVEGRFAASELFTRALARLRPNTQVFTASGETDVSLGALRLIHQDLTPSGALVRVEPLEADIAGYKEIWIARMGGEL
ncbi:carbohydrate kinase [Aquisediminimonas profunda]|uniref:carbohydrate kinase n=1 Tax=Aquisediminimonas profunda TaxID=1550733 RepID=UPI001FE61ECE|nr:carbohydrate kinase [Aquisediminimonas profunda]